MRKPRSVLVRLHIRRTRILIQAMDGATSSPARSRGRGPMRRGRAGPRYRRGGYGPNLTRSVSISAGMMGSEIALMFALSRLSDALLSDLSPDAAKHAVERLAEVLDRGASAGASGQRRRQRQRGGSSPSPKQSRRLRRLAGFRHRGCVRERGPEARRFPEAGCDHLAPEAGLTSNTSSISITSLSAALAEPRRANRFVGTHFFSPVSRMRLVEVIPTVDTDPAFVDAVEKTMVAIGKAARLGLKMSSGSRSIGCSMPS